MARVLSHGGNIENEQDSESSSDTTGSSDEEGESACYFEDDPILLKNNPDYQKLLRCHILLQAQRNAAVRILEERSQLLDYACKDPLQFVQDLAAGKLRIPEDTPVAELPDIDWNKYKPMEEKHMTRTRQSATTTAAAVDVQQQTSKNGVPNPLSCSSYENNKPWTFKVHWTPEEQQRLDELLLQFPPEYNAAERFRKIANALGTRTAIQVQSRVQKYSIALKKSKIHLPGYKTPSINVMRKQPSNNPRRRTRDYGDSRSSFLPLLNQYPEPQQDNDDMKQLQVAPHCEEKRQNQEVLSTDSLMATLPPLERNIPCPQQQRLQAMLILRRWMEGEKKGDTVLHYTFACCVCGESPINNTRFHCLDCDVIKQRNATPNHNPSEDCDVIEQQNPTTNHNPSEDCDVIEQQNTTTNHNPSKDCDVIEQQNTTTNHNPSKDCDVIEQQTTTTNHSPFMYSSTDYCSGCHAKYHKRFSDQQSFYNNNNYENYNNFMRNSNHKSYHKTQQISLLQISAIVERIMAEYICS